MKKYFLLQNFIWKRTISPFIFITLLFISTKLYAQKNMWVGETYMCDATSAVMGLTSNVSWTTSGGYLSLKGSGFYRNVTVTQYFSGSATVKCSWKYRLYSGDTWKSQSRSWTIRCNENPVSISPTKLTLAPGETAYVVIVTNTVTVIHQLQMRILAAVILALLQFQVLDLLLQLIPEQHI